MCQLSSIAGASGGEKKSCEVSRARKKWGNGSENQLTVFGLVRLNDKGDKGCSAFIFFLSKQKYVFGTLMFYVDKFNILKRNIIISSNWLTVGYNKAENIFYLLFFCELLDLKFTAEKKEEEWRCFCFKSSLSLGLKLGMHCCYLSVASYFYLFSSYKQITFQKD